MPNPIYTDHSIRIARISTDAGYSEVKELFAKISHQGNYIELVETSTAKKPKRFALAGVELDRLIEERQAWRGWLKQREVLLQHARTLIKDTEIDFYGSYGDTGEEYTIFRRARWNQDNMYRDREIIWEKVALEDLIDQLHDAICQVEEQKHHWTFARGQKVRVIAEERIGQAWYHYPFDGEERYDVEFFDGCEPTINTYLRTELEAATEAMSTSIPVTAAESQDTSYDDLFV